MLATLVTRISRGVCDLFDLNLAGIVTRLATMSLPVGECADPPQ
jgi:hypothetical protein